MRVWLFLIVFLIKGNLWAHPLHLSVTNLEVRGDSVFGSVRLFSDDFKARLYQLHSINQQITNMPDDTLSQWATGYLSNHLCLKFNSEKIIMNFTHLKRDELSEWYNFSGKIAVGMERVTIENSILTGYFSDQKNLLILKTATREDGLEFDIEVTELECNLK